MLFILTTLAYLTGICMMSVSAGICSPSPLYPYGFDRGDAVIDNADDYFYDVTPNYTITFYGAQYSKLYFDVNGVISFNYAMGLPNPLAFPIFIPYIAPFWADVKMDKTDNGMVFYREVNIDEEADVVDLVKNHSAIAGYPLTPELIMMFTWQEVKHYHGSSEINNTFQAVLASSGNMTITIFNYVEINWIKVADYAAIAFNKGDTATRCEYPISMTEEVGNIVDYSNVGHPGRIVTRVDGDIQLPELTKYRCVACVVDRDSGNLTTFDGFQELNVHEPNRKYLLSKEYNVDKDGQNDKCNYMLKITTDADGRTEWVSFTVNSILKWNIAFERLKKDTVEIRYRHLKRIITSFPFNEIIQDNGQELSITIDQYGGGWIVRSDTCPYVLIYRPNAASKQLQLYLGQQYGGNSYGMCQNNNDDATDDKKKCARPPEDVTSDDFAAVIGESCSCSRFDKRCKKLLSRL